MSPFTLGLERTRHATSPRHAPPATPPRAVLIHAGVTLLWVLLFLRAFGADTVFAWSIGVAYVAYDTALLLFVFVQTLPLIRRPAPSAPNAQNHPRTLGVIIAAHNEAAALPQTLAALFAQTAPPEQIIIADDGSDDATTDLLVRHHGLRPPGLGDLSPISPNNPNLQWLCLPRQGKARALNAALEFIETELVITVDADTILDPNAVAAMRHAFTADPSLVSATGVLFPVCQATPGGRLLQWFQTYEYMRNFLSRYAWARQDGLLLISGAFAAYRRHPVLAVGGFDTDCLVEDYELSHRLLNHAAAHRLHWRTDVIGAARARTDAPSTIGAFLHQRRRWFGGFLQTQLWYRHMIGAPNYGRLGTRMLPVKAFDTLQPLYGLTSIILLIGYVLTGRSTVVNPVAGIIGGKIALDLAFYLWSILLYRRWVGPRAPINVGWAVLAALIEPFSFQLLRHTGAALGWVTFLTGQHRWHPRKRNESSANPDR
ncbi:glycosyltransferase family 2 protein [Rhodopila sp.]|uniref:glycosyltransferase family 2 protein n=1 Tax=Rhodopila sp. TaxID=2480087 RepID=UPI003D14331D